MTVSNLYYELFFLLSFSSLFPIKLNFVWMSSLKSFMSFLNCDFNKLKFKSKEKNLKFILIQQKVNVICVWMMCFSTFNFLVYLGSMEVCMVLPMILDFSFSYHAFFTFTTNNKFSSVFRQTTLVFFIIRVYSRYRYFVKFKNFLKFQGFRRKL